MDAPQRKPIRIQAYDYSQNGAYFVTICTKDRKKILSDIVGDDAHIVPKPYGRIAEKYIRNVPEIEKYVIMPDHIHMIIRLDNGSMWAPTPTKSPTETDSYIRLKAVNIPSIVRPIKVLVTKEIGISIFQRSYYDHVIRNQHDYDEIWEYIENNPIKWATEKQGRE
jgi:REP element-mobilizing transposase RayT